MSIINEFKIYDLLNYEAVNNINILEALQCGNIFVVIDLIEIGRQCSPEEAEETFEELIKHKDLSEIFSEIAIDIIGKQASEDEECVSGDTDPTDLSMTSILYDFYNQMKSVGDPITFTEFNNMSTKFMYKYAEGIQQRYIYDKNKKFREDYESTAMMLQGLAGKLKECPQLDPDGTLHKESIQDKIKKLKSKGMG
jgi:hypothetical protein